MFHPFRLLAMTFQGNWSPCFGEFPAPPTLAFVFEGHDLRRSTSPHEGLAPARMYLFRKLQVPGSKLHGDVFDFCSGRP